jgi:hypothetical protein
VRATALDAVSLLIVATGELRTVEPMTIEPALLGDVAAFVAADAACADRRGALAPATVERLRAAGLLSLAVPARLGGLELDLAGQLDVLSHLAAADTSSAWTVMISTHGPPALARLGLLDTVYGPDPGVLVAGAAAPLGQLTRNGAGWQLTGRWPMCSASPWADKVLLGTRSPVHRMVLADAGDVTVEDTWDALGLRASSSHHVRVDALKVTDPPVFGAPSEPGALYQTAPAEQFAPQMAAIAFGAATSLASVADTDRERLQLRYARMLDAASPDSLEALDAGLAAVVARDAAACVHRVYLQASSTVVYHDDTLGRVWRDLHTLVKHPAVRGPATACGVWRG